ncbi:MAG: hypothetical protein ACO1N3_03955 [Gammaproteobacteria bacterium]
MARSPHIPVPEEILSGTKKSFVLQETGLGGIESITLTYNCGGTRFIKFLSQHDHGIKDLLIGSTVSGKILSASDMDAIYAIQQNGTLFGGLFAAAQEGRIYWVLN